MGGSPPTSQKICSSPHLEKFPPLHSPGKTIPPSKISDSPHWGGGGFSPPTRSRYLENPAYNSILIPENTSHTKSRILLYFSQFLTLAL